MRSKIFASSGGSEARPPEAPVGMMAWWSVTLESSTKRRPSGRSPVPGARSPWYVAGDRIHDFRQRVGDVLRQVAAVGARIADQLVAFVERLRQVERVLRAEAEEAIGVALQFGQVVERRRRHALGLRLDLLDGAPGRRGRARRWPRPPRRRPEAAWPRPAVRRRGGTRSPGRRALRPERRSPPRSGNPRARRRGSPVPAPPAWPAWESARGRRRTPRSRPACRRARDSCPPASRPGCGRARRRRADRTRFPSRSLSKPSRMASGVSDEIHSRLTGLSHPAAS